MLKYFQNTSLVRTERAILILNLFEFTPLISIDDLYEQFCVQTSCTDIFQFREAIQYLQDREYIRVSGGFVESLHFFRKKSSLFDGRKKGRFVKKRD